MSKKTVSYISAIEAAARCLEIGFPSEILRTTVEVWIAAKNSATPFHEPSYGGTIGWHDSVKTLREEGKPHGLEQLSREGVALCVNHEKRTAVAIAQGDNRTGDVDNLDMQPSTKYPRGPRSRQVLNAQLDLFPEEGDVADPFDVWLLLMHMTPSGETRAELSLPALISEGGEITSWHERIILGTFESGALPTAIPVDLTPTEEVITVRKRG